MEYAFTVKFRVQETPDSKEANDVAEEDNALESSGVTDDTCEDDVTEESEELERVLLVDDVCDSLEKLLPSCNLTDDIADEDADGRLDDAAAELCDDCPSSFPCPDGPSGF
jgi:hypothetical protein